MRLVEMMTRMRRAKVLIVVAFKSKLKLKAAGGCFIPGLYLRVLRLPGARERANVKPWLAAGERTQEV